MINRVQQPWHHLPEKEVLNHFETSLDGGLEPANVTERKERFRPNTLTAQKGKGPLALFAVTGKGDIHDKYCQWESGGFPSRPGMNFCPTCRCSDLGYTSVEAEVGGPFREWAKVLLVGGMALTLERIAPSNSMPCDFQAPCRNSIFFFLSNESA